MKPKQQKPKDILTEMALWNITSEEAKILKQAFQIIRREKQGEIDMKTKKPEEVKVDFRKQTGIAFYVVGALSAVSVIFGVTYIYFGPMASIVVGILMIAGCIFTTD